MITQVIKNKVYFSITTLITFKKNVIELKSTMEKIWIKIETNLDLCIIKEYFQLAATRP